MRENIALFMASVALILALINTGLILRIEGASLDRDNEGLEQIQQTLVIQQDMIKILVNYGERLDILEGK